MPTYTCETCLQEFTKKDRYDSHLARKNPCKPPKAVKEIIEEKVQEEVRKLNNVIELVLPNDKKQQEAILQRFFEDLHNLLWNKAGLNPERALEHMTFFFAYRLIESQADSLGLPQECRWSYLANHNNEQDTYDVLKKGCQSFQRNKVTKPFFKKPEIEKADIIYDIIHQINRIPLKALQETDTLGNIFEYMLGRGMSTMSDEGQYFTNREICRLAFKLSYDIKKTLRRANGSLCTFADWFCGTGGFPAEYVKGVTEHVKDINWKNEYKSIYCQDMNLSSVTTTLLNMLILTGIPFGDEHIRSSNSFSEPIIKGGPFKDTTIDYCFMNPPYGGDKSKGKEYKFAYSKGKGVDKKYLVNPDIQSIGIEDDDKVSAGVQLAMATLSENGGICSIVLPNGFFFSSSKKSVELRKKIVEDYKVHYVVVIESGAFVNTGASTCMLVFQKGVGKTENVSFIQLDEQLLVKSTLDELRIKNYSLNYKQYIQQNVTEVEGFDMVKLGDIIEKVKSGKTNSTEISNSGDYDFYGCTAKVPTGKHNTYDFDGEEYLLFAKSGGNPKTKVGENLGIGKFHYVRGKTAGNIAIFQYKIRDTTKVSYRYLYHILRSRLSDIQMLADYTTGNGNINIENMYSLIKLPIPSIKRQQQIVEAIDGWTNLAQTEEVLLKMLEKQVMFQVKEMEREQDRVKLGDICDVNSGQSFRKEDIIVGDIPVIGGGKILGYHNQSNRPGNEFSITRVGDCCLNWFNSPYMLTEHGFSITLKDSTINKYLLNTIYYHFNNVKEDLMLQYDGTAQKLITKTKLRDFDIPKFNLEEVEKLQSDFDEIRHKHAKIAKYNAKAQEAIQRLIPKI